MKQPSNSRIVRGLRALGLVAGAVLFASAASCASGPGPQAVTRGDPWKEPQLVRPAELAALLADSTQTHPLLLHVGFKPLFKGGAIPGSIYAGPGQRPDGIAALKAAVKDVPRDRSIVVYCGCCPWDHCPNMRPAFKTLRDLGFKNAKAMFITKNLDDDWVAKGYPIETPVE